MSGFELLTNINDIDDDLVFEAEYWERPKAHKLRIGVIAAAAVAAVVALTAFMGFETSYKGDGKNKYEITDNNGAIVGSFYFNLKTWDITIPEEYRTTDKWGNPHCFKRMTGTLPSELFEQFGVSPLMNDNFTENIEFKPLNDYSVYNDKGEEVIETDYGYPILLVNEDDIYFHYRLYDKKRQRNISLSAKYAISDDFNIGSGLGVNDKSDYELIKLKDGSMCCVYDLGADFSYEGVLYSLNLYDTDENVGELSIKLTKQILEDLGVL